MKKRIKLFIGILLIGICFVALKIYAQKGNVIQCEIENCSYNKVYLLSIYGTQNTPLDSIEIRNDKFQFEMKDEYPKGMYRLLLNDSTYISFVYNFEPISIKVDNSLEVSSVEILKSSENKVFYDYLKHEFSCSDQMNKIIDEAQTFYVKGKSKHKKEIDSLRQLMVSIDDERRKFSLKLAEKNKDVFSSNIIKAMQVPSYAEYIEGNKEDRYGSEMNFLSIHYFDYIDFSDTALLNTEVVYRSFSTYLRNFAKPANTQGLIRACDMMLARAAENIYFYDYVLKMLIGTFEDSQWTGVYSYLVENHLSDDTLGSEWSKAAKEKAEVFMKLTPGNSAPQIIGIDVKGQEVNLHSMEAKAVLVIFWSADCDHCVHTMPKIKAEVDKFLTKGLKTISISIDVDQMLWRSTIKKLDLLNWHHIIDPEGLESELLVNYNISVTPTFFLLDEQKAIIASPLDEHELEKHLKDYFKN